MLPSSVAYSKPSLFELIFIIFPAPVKPDMPFNAISSPVLNKGKVAVITSFISSAYSKALLLLLTFITFPAPPKPFNPFIAIVIGSKNVACVCSNGNCASILLVITTPVEVPFKPFKLLIVIYI